MPYLEETQNFYLIVELLKQLMVNNSVQINREDVFHNIYEGQVKLITII